MNFLEKILIVLFVINAIVYIFKDKNIKDEKVISKYNMIYKRKPMDKYIFLLFFIPMLGFFVHYLNTYKVTNANASLFLTFVFLFSILAIFPTEYFKRKRLMEEEVYIVKDIAEIIKEKTYHNEESSVTYNFYYFKEYFSRYDKKIKILKKQAHYAEENKEYYLVFFESHNEVYAFYPCEGYELDDELKNKIVTYDTLETKVKRLTKK